MSDESDFEVPEFLKETYREQGRIEERLRILDILTFADLDLAKLTEIRKQIKI